MSQFTHDTLVEGHRADDENEADDDEPSNSLSTSSWRLRFVWATYGKLYGKVALDGLGRAYRHIDRAAVFGGAHHFATK